MNKRREFIRKSLPLNPGDLSSPLKKVIIHNTDSITGKVTITELGGKHKK